jgi:hypothetical protein
MKVGSGAVYDTETGVWYKSRSDAIKALGSELAIPALNKGKRLRILTMSDLLSALGAAAERDITNVSMDCTGVADLLLSSSRSPDGFYDCAATLADFSKHLLEAREELLGHVNHLVYAEEHKSQRISLNTDIALLGLK